MTRVLSDQNPSQHGRLLGEEREETKSNHNKGFAGLEISQHGRLLGELIKKNER